MVSCHFSNAGRHRLMAASTAVCSRERALASASCGQITDTGTSCKLRPSHTDGKVSRYVRRPCPDGEEHSASHDNEAGVD
jgi:hypothetical protein